MVRYLLAHPVIDVAEVARRCQRLETEADELLSEMAELGYVFHDAGWRLAGGLALRLNAGPDRAHGLHRQQVLGALRDDLRAGGRGLGNAELRALTGLDRKQTHQLAISLADAGVRLTGRGRAARYTLAPE